MREEIAELERIRKLSHRFQTTIEADGDTAVL